MFITPEEIHNAFSQNLAQHLKDVNFDFIETFNIITPAIELKAEQSNFLKNYLSNAKDNELFCTQLAIALNAMIEDGGWKYHVDFVSDNVKQIFSHDNIRINVLNIQTLQPTPYVIELNKDMDKEKFLKCLTLFNNFSGLNLQVEHLLNTNRIETANTLIDLAIKNKSTSFSILSLDQHKGFLTELVYAKSLINYDLDMFNPKDFQTTSINNPKNYLCLSHHLQNLDDEKPENVYLFSNKVVTLYNKFIEYKLFNEIESDEIANFIQKLIKINYPDAKNSSAFSFFFKNFISSLKEEYLPSSSSDDFYSNNVISSAYIMSNNEINKRLNYDIMDSPSTFLTTIPSLSFFSIIQEALPSRVSFDNFPLQFFKNDIVFSGKGYKISFNEDSSIKFKTTTECPITAKELANLFISIYISNEESKDLASISKNNVNEFFPIDKHIHQIELQRMLLKDNEHSKGKNISKTKPNKI